MPARTAALRRGIVAAFHVRWQAFCTGLKQESEREGSAGEGFRTVTRDEAYADKADIEAKLPDAQVSVVEILGTGFYGIDVVFPNGQIGHYTTPGIWLYASIFDP